ncbi:tRNA (adenosine(37)-N6)-threonylcarbamoyltransferase complex ATPase subunit type 1 TsaE [Daejeonella sp. H1SJ63]|jgi:tRNA threonylcarbamoyladenosine biosynthesis protein TsaE|uniref:tRNA (adenosine(37)-N6)-threonylcarbamoyltransferase complex ATPase subunit type 1 TsaE n=1 Tax=Daejeonella sp. H1SJ63 TaxID=3034145 RepID=UPI0023EBAF15|nr:tRNA (adenosine(37)-N6)-threonylcarbamoyltransferase complex ATPase subunit type 1 TsaE [Daejeonella sp. H1SJ63]
MKIKLNSELELPEAASALLNFAGDEKVFLLEGEMGAGKTTLIKTICRNLGVSDTASSPTYSIVNEYEYPGGKVYHFDFFRIKNEIEAFDIGFEEYLDSGEYCFIEWPDMISNLWPLHYIRIRIDQDEDGSRIICADKI